MVFFSKNHGQSKTVVGSLETEEFRANRLSIEFRSLHHVNVPFLNPSSVIKNVEWPFRAVR